MNTQDPPKKFSLPVVPVSFIAFIIVCGVLYWWLWPRAGAARPPAPNAAIGVGRLEPFRMPGGTLHTNGMIKTEELRKDVGSWRGTTSSGIRFDATYRYDIELRSDWNFYIDDARKTAIIVAPPYKPQLPVAVDSKTVQEWTASVGVGSTSGSSFRHCARRFPPRSPRRPAAAPTWISPG
jgi:hypothetical protein